MSRIDDVLKACEEANPYDEDNHNHKIFHNGFTKGAIWADFNQMSVTQEDIKEITQYRLKMPDENKTLAEWATEAKRTLEWIEMDARDGSRSNFKETIISMCRRVLSKFPGVNK